MAKGNGRQMENQERIMAEFSRIAKTASKPGYTQNRFVDKLIEAGAIRKAEREKMPQVEKQRYSGKDAYSFIYGNTK